MCRDSLLLFFQVGIDVVDVDDVLVTMLDDVLTTEAFVETTADDVADNFNFRALRYWENHARFIPFHTDRLGSS